MAAKKPQTAKAPRRGATRQASPPAPKRGNKALRAGLALGLVALFVAGLYWLTSAAPPGNQATPAVPAAPESATSGTQDATEASRKGPPESAQPSSEYRFYRLLPETEVDPPDVSAYHSQPRESVDYSHFRLQAGSFRNAADADALRARLLLRGLPNVTTSRVVSAQGSVWYRVRLGPFSDRSALNKAQDALVRMNLSPLKVKVPTG